MDVDWSISANRYMTKVWNNSCLEKYLSENIARKNDASDFSNKRFFARISVVGYVEILKKKT